MVNCVTLNPLDKQISTYTNARVYLANEIGQKRGIHGCQTFHASKNESLGPLGPINCSPRYYAKLMPTESRAEITRIINSNWTHDGQLRVSRMTVSQTCECTEYVARSLQHPAIPQGMHGCSWPDPHSESGPSFDPVRGHTWSSFPLISANSIFRRIYSGHFFPSPFFRSLFSFFLFLLFFLSFFSLLFFFSLLSFFHFFLYFSLPLLFAFFSAWKWKDRELSRPRVPPLPHFCAFTTRFFVGKKEGEK